MLYAILLVAMLIMPYAILKAMNMRKKDRWSNDEGEVIDNWKYPSNFM